MNTKSDIETNAHTHAHTYTHMEDKKHQNECRQRFDVTPHERKTNC